jgi:hypothetical protein
VKLDAEEEELLEQMEQVAADRGEYFDQEGEREQPDNGRRKVFSSIVSCIDRNVQIEWEGSAKWCRLLV